MKMPKKQFRSHKTEKRTAEVSYRPDSLNEEKRTIDFDMATDTPADFGGYYEILGMEDGELRTKRLDDGIVGLLDSHPQVQWKNQTIDDHLGAVIAWRREGNKIVGTILFADDERSERAFRKVKSGILKTGSIGYFVYKHRDASGPEDTKKTYRAIDWEIVEFSLVSIPRDPDAQSRNQTVEKIETIIMDEIEINHERNSNMPPVLDEKNQAATAEQLEQARKNETQRVLDIQSAVRGAGLSDDLAKDLIERGISMVDASSIIMKKMIEAKGAESTPSNPTITIEEDKSRDARVDAMTAALEHRMDSSVKVDGLARNFVGLSMLEIVREGLRMQGKDVRRMDRETLIRQAFQGTSDFPVITGNLMNKRVKKGYDQVAKNFLPLISEVSRTDFKKASSVSLSDAPALEKVNEHGEITTGKFSESAEEYKIETYAKRVGITRQALINDDLGVFEKVGPSFGAAGGRLLHKLIFDIIKNNPKMADSKALFHADHGNLLTPAAASLEALMEAMLPLLRKQTTPKGEFMNLNPAYIVVGADLEVSARKLITSVTASKSDDVNIFSNSLEGVIVEASLPNKTAIVSGRKDEVDMIEVAWLNGQKGVNVQRRENPDTLGVEFDVWMDVGAKAIDWRGLF
ncbi:MAG: prohead protease/major capsid protein fusion protein, partial [Bdellovibrio sp.]